MTAPAPFHRTIRAAAVAVLLCSAAPVALAQAMATAPRTGSGISQEQALALTARLDALERQNAELAAQIQDLKAQASAQTQAVRDEVHNAPTVSVAGGRPTFTSADGKFSVTLRGVIQFDAAAYDQASPGAITTDMRRSGPALGASASNVDLTHARDLKNGDLFRRARIVS